MAVLTISRQFGSGGDEIAGRVGEILGYQIFDRRQITYAAQEAGFSDQEIHRYSTYSEENYQQKKFVEHLLRRVNPPRRAARIPENCIDIPIVEEQFFNEASALGLVQKAIRAACHAGNFIIVGRAGQVILKDVPGVLHIRIEAPLELRIQHVNAQLRAEQLNYFPEMEIRRTAQDLIIERDAASADYVRHFYCVDWADPSLYHAVLNSNKLTHEDAAQVIVQMLNYLF